MNEKTGEQRHILDNQTAKVCRYLQENFASANSFRLVSAYFNIYGYDLLAEELNAVRQVRLLFGDPASIKDPNPLEKDCAVTESKKPPRRIPAALTSSPQAKRLFLLPRRFF